MLPDHGDFGVSESGRSVKGGRNDGRRQGVTSGGLVGAGELITMTSNLTLPVLLVISVCYSTVTVVDRSSYSYHPFVGVYRSKSASEKEGEEKRQIRVAVVGFDEPQ